MSGLRTRRLALELSLIFALVAIASMARAQGNAHSAPLGGRSTLMGGTGVALGEDSAAPFLNPAAIARIDQSSLALSSQLLELNYREVQDFRQPRSPMDRRAGTPDIEDDDVSKLAVTFLPAALCYFQSIGETESKDRTATHTLSFCIATTELRRFDTYADAVTARNDVYRLDETASVVGRWDRTDFNVSWGHHFSDRFALGVAAVVQESTRKLLISSGSLLEDVDRGIAATNGLSAARYADSWGLRGEIGVLIRPDDEISVGISARSPSWILAGTYEGTSAADGLDGSSARIVDRGDFKAPTPMRIALGLGYETERFGLELDVFFYPGQTGFLESTADRQVSRVDPDGQIARDTESIVLSEDSRFVVNAGLGLRYTVNPSWTLLTGLQTDFSNLEDRAARDLTDQLSGTRRDIYLASFGTGYRGSMGDVVAGLRFSYSDGETWAVDNGAVLPVPTPVTDREIAFLFVLYGSLDFGAVAQRLAPGLMRHDEAAAAE